MSPPPQRGASLSGSLHLELAVRSPVGPARVAVDCPLWVSLPHQPRVHVARPGQWPGLCEVWAAHPRHRVLPWPLPWGLNGRTRAGRSGPCLPPHHSTCCLSQPPRQPTLSTHDPCDSPRDLWRWISAVGRQSDGPIPWASPDSEGGCSPPIPVARATVSPKGLRAPTCSQPHALSPSTGATATAHSALTCCYVTTSSQYNVAFQTDTEAPTVSPSIQVTPSLSEQHPEWIYCLSHFPPGSGSPAASQPLPSPLPHPPKCAHTPDR